MNKGAKVAIGCLIALVAACLIAAILMIFAGSWVKEKAGDVFGEAFQVSQESQALDSLDRKFSFSTPADGAVPEERLQAYLRVCRDIKPQFEEMRDFGQDMEHADDPSLSEAGQMIGDIAKLTVEFLKSFREGLEVEAMSPTEFRFISRSMWEAGKTKVAEDPSVIESHRQMIRVLEVQVNDPKVSAEDRRDAETKMREYQERLAEAELQESNPNVTLFQKHKDQLRELDLEGFNSLAY